MIAIKKSSLLISIILFILIVTTLSLPALQIEGAYEYAAANTFEPKMQTTGCIIYVDDDNTLGPWYGTIDHPYQYIQDGISNAQFHDHIYVFNGSYYEHLHINKPLYIEGESNKHTIIDGGFISHVISISAQNVTLTQFTIQNSGITISDAAIIINNPHCTITQNENLRSARQIRIQRTLLFILEPWGKNVVIKPFYRQCL